MPAIVAHSEWEVHRPLGYDADGTRRNLAPGDTLTFHDVTIALAGTTPGPDAGSDKVKIQLFQSATMDTMTVEEGTARLWKDYRIAVLAAHLGGDELGRGLVELEVAVAATVPAPTRRSPQAGGPSERLRVRHKLSFITLHHSGSAEPLRPEDDPVEKLQDLQTWGESDRGWWDVPYHFLIDLDGNIYEGRSYEYMGETNTTYNPAGHLLISVLGNYELQEPTPRQIDAISDLMAWAVDAFDIPLDHIRGHSDLAPTACPGEHLRRLLQDGTFRRAVQARLRAHTGRS